MTTYAGEFIQIRDVPKDVDQKTILTDADGLETITIWAADGTVVVDEEPMTWVPDSQMWVYNWNSPSTFGAYQARLTFTGDDKPSWEYKTIRLRKDKAPV